MVTLTGSEKQVRWATEIRTATLAWARSEQGAARIAADVAHLEKLAGPTPSAITERYAAAAEWGSGLVETLEKITNARWWIDCGRQQKPQAWLESIANGYAEGDL
jgi:hypothetical protein